MSSSPPPPYSLRPPPYVRPRSTREKSSSPSSSPSGSGRSRSRSPPRLSSRELLTEALRRAQRAVTLDSHESRTDVPAAIVAYDEAIGLLQRVVRRRSQRPGNSSEVERVQQILDRYVERVRELCLTYGLPMPPHAAPPPPPPSFASAEDPPSKMKNKKKKKKEAPVLSHPASLLPADAPPSPSPSETTTTTPPALTRTAFIRRLKLERQRSYAVDEDDDDHHEEEEEDDHDRDQEEEDDDEWEQGGPPSLSSPSSTCLTIEMRSPISPVDHHNHDHLVVVRHDHLPQDDDRRWISSAACEEEVKEWGKYLVDEAAEDHPHQQHHLRPGPSPRQRRRRLSDATAASGSSSTGWSAIAVSCGDCVYH